MAPTSRTRLKTVPLLGAMRSASIEFRSATFTAASRSPSCAPKLDILLAKARLLQPQRLARGIELGIGLALGGLRVVEGLCEPAGVFSSVFALCNVTRALVSVASRSATSALASAISSGRLPARSFA